MAIVQAAGSLPEITKVQDVTISGTNVSSGNMTTFASVEVGVVYSWPGLYAADDEDSEDALYATLAKRGRVGRTLEEVGKKHGL